MLAPIFSGEYEGVDNIILTSKYGMGIEVVNPLPY